MVSGTGGAARPALMPLLMVRGGVAPYFHASPYGKGRWHEVTEGIRKSAFDKVNGNADINPQKGHGRDLTTALSDGRNRTDFFRRFRFSF